VNRGERVGSGGGVVAEGEDTKVVVIPFARALSMITRGEITDAKTMIALQYLALHRAGSQDEGLPNP